MQAHAHAHTHTHKMHRQNFLNQWPGKYFFVYTKTVKHKQLANVDIKYPIEDGF